MTTSGISSTTGAAMSGAAAANAITNASAAGAKPVGSDKPGGALDKDAFLKLLVAQLKYQDPMNPAKGSEYIAQTAQFTVVEKLEELAKNAATANAMNAALTATTMVGRRVAYESADGTTPEGLVTGARLDPTGPVLRIGGKDVPLAAVLEIRSTVETSPTAAAPAPTPTAAPATTTTTPTTATTTTPTTTTPTTTTPTTTTPTTTTPAAATPVAAA